LWLQYFKDYAFKGSLLISTDPYFHEFLSRVPGTGIHFRVALLSLRKRTSDQPGSSNARRRRTVEKLPELTDWDIKPPTGAQMAYAVSLCAQLGIVLPAATRRSRGLMQTFLAEAKALVSKRE
jgi:hypothetical protein